jgi:uncharacterized membrane protein
VLEADHETTVRVMAPIEGVWEEIRTIDRLLAFMHRVERFEAQPDGRTARVWSRLAWGPLDWELEGSVALTEAVTPRRLAWSGVIPRLGLTVEGVLELAPGAHDETVLCYRAALRCDHHLVARLEGVLTAGLEDHVETFTARVATLAAQHAQAKQRLRFRATLGSE